MLKRDGKSTNAGIRGGIKRRRPRKADLVHGQQENPGEEHCEAPDDHAQASNVLTLNLEGRKNEVPAGFMATGPFSR